MLLGYQLGYWLAEYLGAGVAKDLFCAFIPEYYCPFAVYLQYGIPGARHEGPVYLSAFR
jgi:hypothetical protein